MVEIEKYSCSDSNESKARERYLFEQLKPSLNTQMPFRLPKESKQNYYNRNKENIILKTKNGSNVYVVVVLVIVINSNIWKQTNTKIILIV